VLSLAVQTELELDELDEPNTHTASEEEEAAADELL